MTDDRLYCRYPECDEPIAGHGQDVCWTHLKQLQRTGKMKPIAEKLSPEERVILAANELAEADTDGDYKSARKKVLQAARALAPKVREEIMRPRGRPRVVDPAELDRLLKLYANQSGKVFKIARKLGVHFTTVYNYLKKPGL